MIYYFPSRPDLMRRHKLRFGGAGLASLRDGGCDMALSLVFPQRGSCRAEVGRGGRPGHPLLIPGPNFPPRGRSKRRTATRYVGHAKCRGLLRVGDSSTESPFPSLYQLPQRHHPPCDVCPRGGGSGAIPGALFLIRPCPCKNSAETGLCS